MARPRKADGERRTEPLAQRYTVAEAEHVRAQAEAAGLDASEYVRRRALGHAVVPAPQRVDAAVISELNRIGLDLKSGVGNNLNQIARTMHTDRQQHIPVDHVLAELRFTISQLDKALAKVTAAYGS